MRYMVAVMPLIGSALLLSAAVGSDREYLLAAIRANPSEDTPRLAYADWLQEHDEDDRAELIRVSIALSHAGDDDEIEKLEARQKRLIKKHPEWLPAAFRSVGGTIAKPKWVRGFPEGFDVSVFHLKREDVRDAFKSLDLPATLTTFIHSVGGLKMLQLLSQLPEKSVNGLRLVPDISYTRYGRPETESALDSLFQRMVGLRTVSLFSPVRFYHAGHLDFLRALLHSKSATSVRELTTPVNVEALEVIAGTRELSSLHRLDIDFGDDEIDVGPLANRKGGLPALESLFIISLHTPRLAHDSWIRFFESPEFQNLKVLGGALPYPLLSLLATRSHNLLQVSSKRSASLPPALKRAIETNRCRAEISSGSEQR